VRAWAPGLVLFGLTRGALAQDAQVEDRAIDVSPYSLEVGAGYTARSDRQKDVVGTVGTRGGALSHAHLEGDLFPERRSVGIWLRLGAERFQLTDRAGTAAPREMKLMEAAAAVAIRGGRTITWEVMGGYGYRTSPMFVLTSAFSDARIGSDHGPMLGGKLAMSLSPWLGLEGRLRAVPVSFGASLGGEEPTVRRLETGLGLSVGDVRMGGARLAFVVQYELGLAAVRTGSADLTQVRHLMGLAVRISRGSRPAPLAQDKPPPPPSPPEPPPPPPAPEIARAEPPPVVEEPTGALRGALWARSRSALSGRMRRLPLGNASVFWQPDDPGRSVISAQSDRRGQFTLEGLPAGKGALRIEAAGLERLDSPMVVLAGQSQTVDLTLDASATTQKAIIRGNVTSARGRRVRATLAVPETGARMKPNRRGLFQFEVPPGRYTLEVTARGYVTQRKTVELTGGEESIFAIELRKSRR
jgi:hypothetical protein